MTRRLTRTSAQHSASESIFELNSVFEFSTVVNASLDLKFIFGHFLLTLMGKLLSLRGIVLLERKPNVFRIENVKGLPLDLLNAELKITKIPKRLISIDREDVRKYPWMKYFKSIEITLLMPLVTQNRIVGLAGFAPNIMKKKVNTKGITYLKSIANIAAVAIEKGLFIDEISQVNRHLDRKIQELNTLFEVGKEFGAILDSDQLVRLLLFSVMGQVGVNRYILCIEKEGAMNVVSSKLGKRFDETLCTYFPSVHSPAMVDELSRKHDVRWRESLKELGIEVIIPLQLQGQTKGILALGEKLSGDRYTQKDLEFLSSLGNLAMISLENARLFRDTVEKQRLEDELLIARDIQKGLLPANLPTIPNYEIAAANISSRQVGGDYYDVIAISPQHYVFAIGDVSGKGTPASLLMANLQATIRALVPLGLSLSDLTKRVNDLINENTTSGRFITFFWGTLHTESKRFTYVNAGHNPPFLIRRDGSVERLHRGGIILGIMKTTTPYLEGEVTLEDGDTLILFTDGISEAMDVHGVEMGEEYLRDIALRYRCEKAEVLLTKIVDCVKEHSKNTMQSDDITLVILKVGS